MIVNIDDDINIDDDVGDEIIPYAPKFELLLGPHLLFLMIGHLVIDIC
jgi:hypothetical protein